MDASLDNAAERQLDGPTKGSPPFHVVGIGASAGGLEALERLFERMPIDTDVAFVVIQHLSPDFKSLTHELLARRTALPIRHVEDGIVVEPNKIYLLPPKKDMVIANGKLWLTDKNPSQMLSLPINHFFHSLAQEAGAKAIGIVLSGTGSDGARGIQEIHEAGGLVIVQSLESAKFDGMPRSALQTGMVDWTLAPEEMPDAIVRYVQSGGTEAGQPPGQMEPVAEGTMQAIFRLLRTSYDIDFSYYKPETIGRRTDRRLQLNRDVDLDEYLKRLENDREELNKLYKDLLIGVTRFFRDKDAFERLENSILPELIQRLRPDEELRLWVAGCATGEEAYSLAILVHEQFEALGRPFSAKILATDVHRASLEFAGAGRYSANDLIDVSPGRLDRFFVRVGDDYQVGPLLRQSIVFAHHNLLKDAPFTRMDLISCRNLLIYFQPLAQKKVLSLFHFSLKTGGILLLGPSESPGELSEEFDTLDGHWKIYRKRRDVRLGADFRFVPPPAQQSRLATTTRAGRSVATDANLHGVYDALLEQFMPPAFLVSESRELLHSFGNANRYLRLRDGRFSADILDLVDADMRAALTGALHRVFYDFTSVTYKGLRVSAAGDELVHLTIKPVRATNGNYALVSIEPTGAVPTVELTHEVDLDQVSKDHLRSLEGELRYTRENLQATIEELETSNEELQATNEELVASNEELQSTNEELHSVNEELYTVNAEYQKKIAELTEANADMDNLLASTQIHTIFLDRNLRIRKYTPQMAEAFNLLPQDLGRRLENFTHGIDYPNLMEDVETVLRTDKLVEQQVRDRRGRSLLLRIVPYHKAGAVEGVLLTLIDISNLKQAESEARLKDQYLTSILRASPHFIFITDLDGRYILTDDAYRQVLGCDAHGKTPDEIYPVDVAERIHALNRQVLTEGRAVQADLVIPQPDGPHTYLCSLFPLRDERDQVIGVSGIQTDVTALKRAEEQANEAVRQRDRFLAMLSHELRNPLAAIVNAARILERADAPSQEVAPWVSLIGRRSDHMVRLLDDLLDSTRITHDKIEIRRQHLDLGDTIADVLEEIEPWAKDRGIQLFVERPAVPLPIEGDPDRLQQVQVNLLGNAVKYTPAGGSVWYSLGVEAGRAVIRVRDTGCGMEPDMLEQVFQLFVQAGNAAGRRNDGLGVGLSLVRSLVQLHGGEVTAHSDGLGKGSEFVVRLPLSAPAPIVAANPQSQRPTDSAHTIRRILIVEDDPDVRSSMEMILRPEGYEIFTAANGQSALDFLEVHSVDAALVDVGLPDFDGYELARRICRQRVNGRPKLYALTGFGRPSDKEAAHDAGFDAHLTKPVRIAELTNLLAVANQDTARS